MEFVTTAVYGQNEDPKDNEKDTFMTTYQK